MKRVAVVIGTRPEAVKMAPVVRALRDAPDLTGRVIVTAQHREMLDQVLSVFEISPDRDLDLMRPDQTLPELTARLVVALDRALADEAPDLVLVQGDTTTAAVAALAAYYRRLPVGHVEAGLRSGDRYDPFPEEVNRRLAGVLATLHFAPTERARRNLLSEGVPAERVFLTGNTVVDALQHVVAGLPPAAARSGQRLLFMTMHRRESWGGRIAEVCRAVRDVVEARPQVEVLFPVHRNPIVRGEVEAVLADTPRVTLAAPLDYVQTVEAMRRCDLVLTDSGGIQEEAPSLGKPVLVLRETTERPEAIEAGCARLVGTDRARVRAEVLGLLDDPSARAAMAGATNPFGDGRAAERIVAAVRRYFGST